MDKLRLLPDVPVGEGVETNVDGLRFEQYAMILARAALDTPEPFTIGVYGGWGCGKTSMMRMIKGVVESEESAIGIWFNAWRYEKEEHLIIPLLATIITEINKQESGLKEGVKEAARKLRDALRAVLYGVSVKGKLGVPGLTEAELSVSPGDMIERYEKLSEMATERILDQSLYFRSFSKLDDIAKEVKGIRLVVFVDDLDRCFPDKAVALLENVKLVLNQPNIAFVLGIAPRVIQAYLKAKYKKDYEIGDDLYEDYLDKLVQLPFPVPEIKHNVKDYVRGLLKREEVFGEISPDDFKKDYEPLVSICGPACKNNPRAIIRFLNRLLILKSVHTVKEKAKSSGEGLQISLVHFGITNALQMKWPEVFRACELNRNIPKRGASGESALSDCLCEIFDTRQDEQALISELEAYADMPNNPESEIFRNLSRDESLRALLASGPGREWLTRPKLRKEAAKTVKEVKTDVRVGRTVGNRVYMGLEIKPGADLGGENLERADLEGANLQGANLVRTNFEQASLVQAFLGGANMQRANLVGADLRRATLFNADLTDATYDAHTQWPDRFDPVTRGAVKVDRD